MEKIQCRIKGVAPFYFSKPTKDKTPKTEAKEIEVAKNRVYCTEAGALYAPSRQIRWCIISAITMAKMKIERSSKRAKELFISLVFIEPDEILFQPGKTMDDIKIIEHWTQLDMGKIKPVKVACIPEAGWTLEFIIHYNELIEPEFIKEALDNAGMLCGIGGKRLDHNGRFEVVEFKS